PPRITAFSRSYSDYNSLRMALTSGTKLGPYEIQAPLGVGGMGEVYRAHDSRLDRPVAIKVLPSSIACDPVARQRLEREARAVSKIPHPHICTLHDIGHQDGVDFLVHGVGRRRDIRATARQGTTASGTGNPIWC